MSKAARLPRAIHRLRHAAIISRICNGVRHGHFSSSYIPLRRNPVLLLRTELVLSFASSLIASDCLFRPQANQWSPAQGGAAYIWRPLDLTRDWPHRFITVRLLRVWQDPKCCHRPAREDCIPRLTELQSNDYNGLDFAKLHVAVGSKPRDIGRELIKNGVTSSIPMITSSIPEVYHPDSPCIGKSTSRTASDGTECLGAHVEGPFLNSQRNDIRADTVSNAEAADI